MTRMAPSFEADFAFACFDAGWTPCGVYAEGDGWIYCALDLYGEGAPRCVDVICRGHDRAEAANAFHKALSARGGSPGVHMGWWICARGRYHDRCRELRELWVEFKKHSERAIEFVRNAEANASAEQSPAPSAPEEQKMTTKVENSTIKNTLSAAKDAAVEGAKLAASQQASRMIRDTVRGYMPASYVVAVSSPLGEAAESFLVPMLIHAAVDLVPNVPNVDKVKSAAEYAMTAEAKDRLGVLLAQLAPMLRELGSKMGTGA